MHAPASWCEIDRGALRHNLDVFADLVGGVERLLPVIKANAYGHGMEPVSDLLVGAGVARVGVNELDEALRLKSRHPALGVLVLGYVPLDGLPEAVAAGVEVVVYRADALEALAGAARAQGRPARVHLKVETGTQRQGLEGDELLALATRAATLPGVELAGIETHFADIEDTTDDRYARDQLRRFEQACARLADAGVHPARRHAANTAATLNLPETHLDQARVGIGLYGLWPSQETLTAARIRGRTRELRPVLAWKARIAQVKEVAEGAFVGYGRTWRAGAATRLAVLPVGYYDGYDRDLSNHAHVLIRGRRAPVRGRVCMNMAMVDVSHVPDVSVADEVVLLGASGDERLRAEDLAAWAGTIHYEITTRISERLPRVVTG